MNTGPGSRMLTVTLAVSALGPAALALGFAVEASWATAAWPFETGRLTNWFLASILAAIAAPTVWVSATREWGALRASALFPFLMLIAMAVFLVGLQVSGDDSGLVPYALAMALGALYAMALMIAGSRVPLRNRRRLPRVVRASFAVFAVVLVATGLALVAGAENVIPWPATDDSLVMFGFIFCAAASSYAWGALRPVWGYATAPLLGFLAYDIILLPPLIDHFSDVVPDQRLSLVLYVGVLGYSGALASYYLLIRPETRLWANRAPRV